MVHTETLQTSETQNLAINTCLQIVTIDEKTKQIKKRCE